MAKVIIILLIIFNVLIFTDVEVFPQYAQDKTTQTGYPKEPKYNWQGKPSGLRFEQETRYTSLYLEKMRAKPKNEKIKILLVSLTICNILLIIKYLRNPKIK